MELIQFNQNHINQLYHQAYQPIMDKLQQYINSVVANNDTISNRYHDLYAIYRSTELLYQNQLVQYNDKLRYGEKLLHINDETQNKLNKAQQQLTQLHTEYNQLIVYNKQLSTDQQQVNIQLDVLREKYHELQQQAYQQKKQHKAEVCSILLLTM